MKGNIFMCLNKATYEGNIPAGLKASYARRTYDEDGVQTAILDTTFKEVVADNLYKYGGEVEIDVSGTAYFLVELDASWITGEVSLLLELGDGLSYPNNCLLTNSEARKLVSDNALDLE